MKRDEYLKYIGRKFDNGSVLNEDGMVSSDGVLIAKWGELTLTELPSELSVKINPKYTDGLLTAVWEKHNSDFPESCNVNGFEKPKMVYDDDLDRGIKIIK